MGTISVGKLRQNPTQMLREVADGARYTVTDRGKAVAEVRPVRAQRWVSSTQFDQLLRSLGPDHRWAEEIREDREAEDARDPWEDTL